MTPFIEIDYKCLFWATKVGDNNNIDIGYISISMSNEQWIFSLFSLSTISFSFLFSSSASSSSPSAHFFSPFAPLSVIPFRFGNSKKIVSTQKQTNYEFWWALPLVMIHYQWINCLPGFLFSISLPGDSSISFLFFSSIFIQYAQIPNPPNRIIKRNENGQVCWVINAISRVETLIFIWERRTSTKTTYTRKLLIN